MRDTATAKTELAMVSLHILIPFAGGTVILALARGMEQGRGGDVGARGLLCRPGPRGFNVRGFSRPGSRARNASPRPLPRWRIFAPNCATPCSPLYESPSR